MTRELNLWPTVQSQILVTGCVDSEWIFGPGISTLVTGTCCTKHLKKNVKNLHIVLFWMKVVICHVGKWKESGRICATGCFPGFKVLIVVQFRAQKNLMIIGAQIQM